MLKPKKHIVEAYSLTEKAYIEVAELSCLDPNLGVYSPVRIEYALDAMSRISNEAGLALSSRVPPSWDIIKCENWPGFLTDLLPQGHARSYWTKKLGVPDGPVSDWTIVAYSGKNPVGHLRIQNKSSHYQKKSKQRNFQLADLEQRSHELLEYLEELGEPVSSFTGAGGASPKFFLAEGYDASFFAQSDRDESEIKSQYLVKFPASRLEIDRHILRAEAAYLKFAAQVLGEQQVARGKRLGDALLTERFDRIQNNGSFERVPVESFYQRLGIPGHGKFLSLYDAAVDIAKSSPNPQQELTAFLQRDLINLALSNTDLHGRNYSFLRDKQGALWLSPVYDLAPMAFSSELILRYARAGWRNADLSYEESSGLVDWPRLCEQLATCRKELSSRALLQGVHQTQKRLLALQGELDLLLQQEDVQDDLRLRILAAYERQLSL